MHEETWYYLDDFRNPPKKPGIRWVVYRVPWDLLSDIKRFGLPDGISLDYDLDQDMTGHDVARLILTMFKDGIIAAKPNFKWAVHSSNPIGSERIRLAMKELDIVMLDSVKPFHPNGGYRYDEG